MVARGRRHAWVFAHQSAKAGVLGATAMGIQNAAGRLVWSSMAPSAVMTGKVTQLVIDLVDLARAKGDPTLRSRVHKFL